MQVLSLDQSACYDRMLLDLHCWWLESTFPNSMHGSAFSSLLSVLLKIFMDYRGGVHERLCSGHEDNLRVAFLQHGFRD